MKITKTKELNAKQLETILRNYSLKEHFSNKSKDSAAQKNTLKVKIDRSAHEYTMYRDIQNGGVQPETEIASVSFKDKGSDVSVEYTLKDLIKIVAKEEGIKISAITPMVSSASVKHERTPDGQAERFSGLSLEL